MRRFLPSLSALQAFDSAARHRSFTRAADDLGLTQSGISRQIGNLETSLGNKLFERIGSRLVLTDVGRTVYRYADEIFALGHELQQAVKGRVAHPARLAVGVALVIPKLVAYQILEPALHLPEAIQLDCVHERPERLVADLAIYALDLVVADTPAPPAVKVRAYSHLLGECGVSVFGSEQLAARYRRGFPRSLDGAPFLLPSGDSGLRLSLEEWFRKQGMRPRVVGNFDDNALIDAFGQAGAGLFAMPSAIDAEVRRQYRVRLVGRLETVRQRFYAITVERQLRNPAVIAISERARKLFA